MVYWLSEKLLEWTKGTNLENLFSASRLFLYITVRTAGAAVTALLLCWWLGPKIIAWLKRLKFGQEYVDRAEEAGDFKARVLSKKGTPTMGGIMIVLALNLSTLIWARWDNTLIQLTLLSVVVLMALGFYDDYAKIIQQSGGGTKPAVKLWVQFGLAVFVALYLWQQPTESFLKLPEYKLAARENLISTLMVPFYKYPIHAGAVVGLLVTVMAIVGSSNAVNLTDGLDGLAIGCTLITASVFLVFTYVAGNSVAARYLQIPYVEGAGELTIFCAAMVGAALGFLWFNCHPAQVFMGDTGSLSLGGALGIIAVLIHQPLVLVIAGGVFVMEAVSVMLQTGYYKFSRWRYGAPRRIFLMAPLHHHFEKKGWHETQVVIRFYILCILCAVVALSTLKIR